MKKKAKIYNVTFPLHMHPDLEVDAVKLFVLEALMRMYKDLGKEISEDLEQEIHSAIKLPQEGMIRVREAKV